MATAIATTTTTTSTRHYKSAIKRTFSGGGGLKRKSSGGGAVLAAAAAAAERQKKREQALERGIAQVKKLYTELFGDNDAKSSIEDRASSDDYYPKFEKQELQLGKVLGKGGFGTVYEIKAISIEGLKVKPASTTTSSKQQQHYSDDEEEEDEEDALQDEYEHSTRGHQEQHETQLFQSAARLFLAQHCLRKRKSKFSFASPGADARYAVKILSDTVVAGDAQQFLQGMMDMAIETRFLCALEHPNIVKIRGMAGCSPFGGEYFIVMDRLYDTLEKRIYQTWKPKQQMWKSTVSKLIVPQQQQKKQLASLWEERLVYAYDLSSALTYLHQRRIIYRDLKPENVGFDCRNDVKLFDFGLCRELKESDKLDKEELYRLTAETGSPRYMAPEVALGKPYNTTCDTYSFSILLWQMLALNTPFECYTMTKMKQRVWGTEQKRPQLGQQWPAVVKLLLQRGWSPAVPERYTMKQVEEILRQEVVRIRNGNDAGLEHERRRSSFVFSHTTSQGQRQKDAVNTIQSWYEEEDFSETLHNPQQQQISEEDNDDSLHPIPRDELDDSMLHPIFPEDDDNNLDSIGSRRRSEDTVKSSRNNNNNSSLRQSGDQTSTTEEEDGSAAGELDGNGDKPCQSSTGTTGEDQHDKDQVVEAPEDGSNSDDATTAINKQCGVTQQPDLANNSIAEEQQGKGDDDSSSSLDVYLKAQLEALHSSNDRDDCCICDEHDAVCGHYFM